MLPLRIGIDTGGTFTDVAVLERGRLTIHKLPSTPDDPAQAVLDGLRRVRPDREVDVVHGTTVGLNAVLTGSMARTALVTNQGFRDLCEIGRQDRVGLYDLEPRRTPFPVPRSLRFELPVRRAADGSTLTRLRTADIDALVERLARARVASIAICLLHSYRDPTDERRVATRLARKLGVPVTCSAELLPRHGEFERFAAATLNAGIRPIMGTYLERLERGVAPGRIRLMRSSGGIMPTDEAARFPARAAFSGPAGGVLATAWLAGALRTERVAALDMGGTSTDVALVGRRPTPTEEDRKLGGIPLALPSLDVHTVGCGGGSIAFADAGGALRVGPQSAGADPGPACYGKGDEPTVTDAHVALGHIGPDTLLGGSLRIDPDRAVHAIERLAHRLGTAPKRCATGILEIAEVEMMRALLVITSERAVDPARVPLVAYGGAGGLHAASLARRLSMPGALVPREPGAFSAIGLALAGETGEAQEAVLERLDRIGASELQQRAAALSARATSALDEGHRRPRLVVDTLLRFAGQGAGLWIPWSTRLATEFRKTHLRRFGFSPDAPIEVVELRARATAAGPKLGRRTPAKSPPRRDAPVSERRTPPLGGRRIPVYRRDDLEVGTCVAGPSVIVEQTGVILVLRGHTAVSGPHAVSLTRTEDR